MRAFKVFVFGLLYGWFIKVAFDRIYRENALEDLRNENAALRDHVRSLELQVRPKSLESKSVRRSAPQAVPLEAGSARDDLRQIKGVGPAIEKRLHSAGIFTFAALAQLTPEQVREQIGSTRTISATSLITQARKLSRKE